MHSLASLWFINVIRFHVLLCNLLFKNLTLCLGDLFLATNTDLTFLSNHAGFSRCPAGGCSDVSRFLFQRKLLEMAGFAGHRGFYFKPPLTTRGGCRPFPSAVETEKAEVQACSLPPRPSPPHRPHPTELKSEYPVPALSSATQKRKNLFPRDQTAYPPSRPGFCPNKQIAKQRGASGDN